MIKGPIFTVFTAFKENGELNLKSTLDYLDFLLSSEAKVLYTMPYNSRFLQLTIEEILKLNKEVISLVKSNKNSKIIVGGPVEISTQKEMDFAKQIGKPILGIKRWGEQRSPQSVVDCADEMVAWNSASIVAAIRRLVP